MDEQVRIDKWLWHARFYRSRLRAQEAAGSGLIRLNGNRVEKPSTSVRPGDVLTLPQGRTVVAVRIEALALRRGAAPEARKLYRIVGEGLLDPAPVPS
ncbi:MAG TPA: RNA-binding S4 domain-containing protein [Rhizomicrobium sp.]|jgi:ribosome-associated heat shock protein Hsp15